MSYISGSNVYLKFQCDTQAETFELVDYSADDCTIPFEQSLSADLEITWYASAAGGSLTVEYDPVRTQTIDSAYSESAASLTVTEYPSDRYVVSYTGSGEPTCDFEVWDPNTTGSPRPKVILLPKPNTGPGDQLIANGGDDEQQLGFAVQVMI